MSTVDLKYIYTEDGLRLPGVHYPPAKSTDVCVLLVPGMSGTILENYFAHVLGTTLTKNGYGFVYGHNRGYGHINDVRTSAIKPEGSYHTIRTGTMYERFADCVLDIAAWLQDVRSLGYTRTVLMGHSLGSIKSLYYLSEKGCADIEALVLASPPDMIGLARKYEPNFGAFMAEATNNLAAGEPRKLLSDLMWQWYPLSSRSFMDLFEQGGPADVLPLLEAPDEFPALAAIDVPVLAIAGERDDVVIRTVLDDLQLLVSRCKRSPRANSAMVLEATHSYERCEQPFADAVLSWLDSTLNREV